MVQPSNPFMWAVTDILRATNGKLLSGSSDSIFSDFFIDSRQFVSDAFFVAIPGQTHDGHAYVKDVIEKGAPGVVIEEAKASNMPISEWKQKGVVCIGVDDTIQALGKLAHYHRCKSEAVVVAVTGSNGKTTTREMTVSVLSQKFQVHSSFGNYNNEIGLPLTLFKIKPHHTAVVVELGMNHFGEIANLTRICDPNIGVLTNIGPAHLEGVGSIEGVMKAKGELFENMKPNGTAVLNIDDPMIQKLSQRLSMSSIVYGCSDKAYIRALSIESTDNETHFTLLIPDHPHTRVRMPVPGAFMVYNALAAASVGFLLNLSPEQIRSGIESFKPVKGRMNITHTKFGIHVIDDTYNANPASMEAAIRTLVSLKGNHRAILVIGDMKELGDHSNQLHHSIGSIAGSSGISKLYVTGSFADQVISGALHAGMPAKNIVTGSKQDIMNDLSTYLKPQDWILVKGSRAMGMEVIAEYLKKM